MATESYQPIRLDTDRGEVDCQYYHGQYGGKDISGKRAVIFVTGVGGGWGTPARGLYPRLCNFLVKEGISGLRVKYRHPTDLSESVFDVLAGIEFLKQEQNGIKSVGLVGHSFGGAVVIQAASIAPDVVSTVVTIATQSYGAIDAVLQLKRGISLLLIHGTEDKVLPASCSRQIYKLAHEPKQLAAYNGAGHDLDIASEDVYKLVYDWLVKHLKQQ